MQLERTPAAKAMGYGGFLEGAASCEVDLHFPQTFAIVNKTKVQRTAWVAPTMSGERCAWSRSQISPAADSLERLSTRRPQTNPRLIASACHIGLKSNKRTAAVTNILQL